MNMRRSVPDALPIQSALQSCAPWEKLQQRLADSRARLEAVRTSMPEALHAHVSAGPVDDSGWTLVARNAAVAAKLRQLQPRLESALRQRGWQVIAIRIHGQSGAGASVYGL